jgi:uncharacterized protein (TIGR04255 family)
MAAHRCLRPTTQSARRLRYIVLARNRSSPHIPDIHMAKQRHLPHAPITEALIDIQVLPRDGLEFSGLQEAIGTAEFGYYVKSPITEGTFGFMLSADGRQPQATAESAPIGLRLHSHDEKYVAQCRVSGFTLSRLPPYEDWKELTTEAKRLWATYTKGLSPQKVTRVATRFINNLQLPMDSGASYQKYLNKFVDVPNETPQAVASFLQSFQLVDVEIDARVNLTLALDNTPPGERVPVILDIDAFKVANFDPPSQNIWDTLENLRQLKNQCFFGTITEATAELYA